MTVILQLELPLRSLSSLGRGRYSGRGEGTCSLGLRTMTSGEATLGLGKVAIAYRYPSCWLSLMLCINLSGLLVTF